MKKSSKTPVVAFFVRAPVPGQVKTRLAPALGAEGACRLYQAMVSDILDNIGPCGLPLFLFHDGQEAALPPAWVKAASKVIAQSGEGIGERMAAAFAHCFAEDIEQVILIGSDIPGLNAEMLREASEALAAQDAVLAPTVDGGYCLIALKQTSFRPEIFQGVPWSTGQVLQATLQKFKTCGLTASLLKKQRDMDTLDDLKAYSRASCPQAVATNGVVAEIFSTGEVHTPGHGLLPTGKRQ